MMATVLKLLKCDNCGKGGYDHRRLGLLVDGHLVAERVLCRPCAVDRISDAVNTVEHGDPSAFTN